MRTDWYGKPYYSLDAYCKNTYHKKLYKIALNAHLTCPNRDGTLGLRGCIFCSAGGSGDFALDLNADEDIEWQLENGLALFRKKQVGEEFIAYFQAFTNTYGPLPYLEQIYRSALSASKVRGISIATRPDCVEAPIVALLRRLQKEFPDKFIWVELGLQTIHPSTAAYIRRGYELDVFDEAYARLTAAGIPVIVHLILGLPGETRKMILESIQYLNVKKPFGVKLQLLHVLRDTDLAKDYEAGRFQALTKEAYLSLLSECIARLDPAIILHRVTGDAKASDLLAPDWSRNKKDVLNSLHHLLKEQGIWQGCHLNERGSSWYKIP